MVSVEPPNAKSFPGLEGLDGFDGISTIVVYLMPNALHRYI